jgi:hypothetical protein
MAFDNSSLYSDTPGSGFNCKNYSYTTLDLVAVVSGVGYFNVAATRLGIGDIITVFVVNAINTAIRSTRVDTAILTVDTISAGVVTTSVFSTSNVNAPVSTAQAAADALVASNAATAIAFKADAAATTTALAGKQATLTAGQLPGTATNDAATAGNVGEFISSNVPVGTPVAVVSGTPKDITSISLTAGDWDVWGMVNSVTGAGTVITITEAYIGTVSATRSVSPNGGAYVFDQQSKAGSSNVAYPVGVTRLSLAVTTTVYLGVFSTFTTSTNSYYGFIGARRRR